MGNKRDEKRAELRKRLIEAAEDQISQQGIDGLKARAVTAQAGCALGALYNAFEDLDMLIMHVNSRTLARLGAALRSALPEQETSPEEVMQALATRYVDFACENHKLWIALFEHRPPEGHEIPEWHRQDHAVLIEVIVAPLKQLRPDLDDQALVLRSRTTFAAVHGVVLLALQGRFVGVPMQDLRQEVSALVSAMTRGAHLAV
ncbi:TetR/AcrR family transcriptional regulator [Aliiroseovarius sp. KMU-50]|uniref:TetR/AcrR family transcriptional regulator n=1 Tax=Aliiroseovarius salicola TaxID=3009082 RepID=A0ABT4W5Q4_9RHOB|nr:TetR/AcrR family transcriptional regulator [Aliiroseovarius sp. KMU-50]MDA5095857.1 TetR/AcrR family transcriptional regulator [Aliiroseovarius sp. KMU-50]